MKTHIIQLENHDDVYSAMDKMIWGKSGQILLVIPAGNSNLKNKLDLILLQRKASHLGAQLGIVTKDGLLRNLAKENSIAWFDNTSSAQGKVWRTKKAEPLRKDRLQRQISLEEIRTQLEHVKLPKIENTWLRVTIFGVAIFSLILLLVVLLPHATIKLPVKQNIQMQDLVITGVINPSSQRLIDEIPVSQATVILTISGSAASTGSTSIPLEKAKGFVQFRNISAEPVEIPAGIRVWAASDPHIGFVTLAKALLKANSATIVTVPVEAINGGISGNVAAGVLITISDEFNTSVLVSNSDPTIGGTDVIVLAPTDKDFQDLKKSLIEQLKVDAITQMQANGKSGEKFLEETVYLDKIIEETVAPDVNLPGDQIQLTIKAQFSAFSIKETDLYSAAQSVLDASLPVGWNKKENTFFLQETSPVKVVSLNPIKLEFDVQAAQLLTPGIDQTNLIQEILGKSKYIAAEIISKKMNLVSFAEIKITPGIWQWMPFLPVNIELSYQ